LVRETIGTGWSEADRSFREWLVSASGGNPFFLHSLVRHYQTTGQQFTLSPTINALLDQRLATLTPAAMTVLWTTVALGNHSTLERLTRALEMPHMELVTTIRELEVARLIGQSGQLVTPAHWLISDAVARKANVIADKLGHRRIAGILEAEARVDNDADKLWDCAQHWLAADDRSRAIEMLTRCAQYSIEIGRVREAAELLLKAASLATEPQRYELACKAIQIIKDTGEHDLIDRAADMVETVSRSGIHDDVEFAILHARVMSSPDDESARSQLQACVLSCDAESSHRINAARALLSAADHHRNASLGDEMLLAVDTLLQSSDQTDDPAALKFWCVYHATAGDALQCVPIARRLLDAAQNRPPEVAADLFRYAGAGLWRAGDVFDAIAAFEAAFERAGAVGLRRFQFTLASTIASLLFDAGREQDSRRWREKGERIADDLPAARASVSYIAGCAEMAFAQRDIGELKRLLEGSRLNSESGRIGRTRRVTEAIEIGVRLLSGEVLDSDSMVRQLTCHHVVQGESGNLSDFETAIAAAVLETTDRAEDARTLVGGYLQDYRRGFAPIATVLRNTARKLCVENSPAWCRIDQLT
jgi:tetratricopeptide (TPR) repeat protein